MYGLGLVPKVNMYGAILSNILDTYHQQNSYHFMVY